MKRDFINGLFVTLFIVSIFLAGYFIALHQRKVSKENYNDGICAECGGEYRFASAEHTKSGDDRYFYTCEDCGHTIMTFRLMK